ncbi:LPD25 domain-containing protein [Vibrio harveyi]
MSHSLSTQVHSTKAANASNVSPLHHSSSTTVKVAPRSVLVNWSESSRLNEGEQFPFDIFEAIALKAALDNPLGGYDKTDITVNFDNGHQHRCRVDLGCGGNECGFADHCFRVLEYALSLEKSEPSHWYFTHAQGRELLALLKTYHLNRQVVAISRSQVIESTRLAKAQQEAEEQAKAEQRKAAHQQRVEREKAFQASLLIPDCPHQTLCHCGNVHSV